VIGTVGGEWLDIEERVSVTLDEMRDAFVPTLEQLVHADTTISTEELFEG
jgi:hypothetical protein